VATTLAEERIDTAVGKIQVLRGGSGDPLVYLHSATGEVTLGLPMLEDLADDFDVIAPVFPGFGESEGIDGIDDIEDAAFHAADVLDRLGLRAPAVMGLSLGGWMAAELATRWPERVSRLILVNAVGLYIEGAEIGEIFGRTPAELAADLFADQSHPLAQMMHALGEFTGDVGQQVEVPMELLLPIVKSMGATAKVGWRPYLHNPKLRRRLFRVTAPTLVVHGVQDGLVPRAHAEAYAEEITNARIVDIDDASHLLPLEKPAELAAVVRDFMRA
jgi:pimeloyl-ACP methyl ester carboxylesterase